MNQVSTTYEPLMQAEMMQDIDSILERMNSREEAEADEELKRRIRKKRKLAKIVLEDAVAEGAFDEFPAGTSRMIEMARVLNERLVSYYDRTETPEKDTDPEPELIDTVTEFMADLTAEERLRGEELWDIATQALQNDQDPILAMKELLGHELEEPGDLASLLEEEDDEEEEEADDFWEESEEDLTPEEAEAVKKSLDILYPEDPETEPETEPEPVEEPTQEPEPVPEVELEPEPVIETESPSVEIPEPEPPVVPEPEAEPEPVTDEQLDTSATLDLRWSDQVETEHVLEPPVEPPMVDTDGRTIKPLRKNKRGGYSGPVPVVHDNDPKTMTSIFVKEKQVERKIEQIVDAYEETLSDLDEYLQRLTALRDAVRRRL